MSITFLLVAVGFLLLLIAIIVTATAINDFQQGRATVRRTAGLVSAAVALLILYLWIAVGLDAEAVPR